MNNDHSPYIRQLEFLCDLRVRERFVKGSLSREWAARYPQIFDAADLEQSLTQPTYHFVEWVAAVLIYESTARLSLIEKYTCANHPRKTAKLKEVLGGSLFDWCCENDSCSPDLFVYSETTNADWFFCEVKGPKDEVREGQYDWFRRFHKKSGKRGYILQLREPD